MTFESAPMRIVLSGITGCRNRGVEALIVSTVEQMRARLPNSAFDILTLTPEEDAAALKGLAGARFHHANARGGADLWRHRLARVAGAGLSPLSRVIAGANLLVVSGGDLFGPDYGRNAIRWGLWAARVAAAHGVPYAFEAQSLGPFADAAARDAFVRVARGAHHVAVREQLSLDYATGDLGLEGARVPLVADPAFLLEPSARGGELLDAWGLGGDPFVVLAPARSLARIRGLDTARLAGSWAAVAAHIVETWGESVLLVPHVRERDPLGDDAILAREVAALAAHPRVRVADGELRAADFKALAARAAMVVSQRMHVAIAGLSSGVPTVAVGFSVKYPGITSAAIGRDATREGLFVTVEDFTLRTAVALGVLDRARARRGEVASWLAANRAAMRSLASRGFDLLAEAVR